jgi:hypothetical protein
MIRLSVWISVGAVLCQYSFGADTNCTDPLKKLAPLLKLGPQLEREAREAQFRNPFVVTPTAKFNWDDLFPGVKTGMDFPTRGIQGSRPVLVSISALEPDESVSVIKTLHNREKVSNLFEFYFGLSDDSVARFKKLPEWTGIDLLVDRTRLQDLPEDIRPVLLGWLERLKSSSSDSATKGKIRIVVDHFDNRGVGLNALEERVRHKDFEGNHLVLMICNPDQLADYLRLARVALQYGNVQSVSVPSIVLDGDVQPLVLETALRIEKSMHVSPTEIVPVACREVRERLQRCEMATDIRASLQAEFQGYDQDPVNLFRNKDNLEAEVKRMIRHLELLERSFIKFVDNRAIQDGAIGGSLLNGDAYC